MQANKRKAQTDKLTVLHKPSKAEKQANQAAEMIQKDYRAAAELMDQGKKIYMKFKDVVERMREPLEIVREFFAHKKKDELLLGKYAAGPEWAEAELGVSYRHLCRLLTGEVRAEHLLPEAADSAAKKPSTSETKSNNALTAQPAGVSSEVESSEPKPVDVEVTVETKRRESDADSNSEVIGSEVILPSPVIWVPVERFEVLKRFADAKCTTIQAVVADIVREAFDKFVDTAKEKAA